MGREHDVSILLQAPFRRDAAMLSAALEHGWPTNVETDQNAELALEEPGEQNFIVICTQEGFTRSFRAVLERACRSQPDWAQIPLVLIVDDELTPAELERELDGLLPACAPTILHRPLRQVEFLTAVRNAVLARRRQLEIADHLDTQDELHHELNHRIKNMLSTVMAVYNMSLRQSEDLEDFDARFNERIEALSAVHDHLRRRGDERMPLRALAEMVVAPYRKQDGPQVTLSGEPMHLSSRAAIMLGLMFNELATNAAKYGALSRSGAGIAVNWRGEGDDTVVEWRERDGPPVRPPERYGYGSRFIERGAASLGGNANMEFAPSGLRCVITLPTDQLS